MARIEKDKVGEGYRHQVHLHNLTNVQLELLSDFVAENRMGGLFDQSVHEKVNYDDSIEEMEMKIYK